MNARVIATSPLCCTKMWFLISHTAGADSYTVSMFSTEEMEQHNHDLLQY